jgi:hypothetical protein
MDSAVHGLLRGDVIVVNKKAKAKLATFLIFWVWGNSWLKEFAIAVEKRQGKN